MLSSLYFTMSTSYYRLTVLKTIHIPHVTLHSFIHSFIVYCIIVDQSLDLKQSYTPMQISTYPPSNLPTSQPPKQPIHLNVEPSLYLNPPTHLPTNLTQPPVYNQYAATERL